MSETRLEARIENHERRLRGVEIGLAVVRARVTIYAAVGAFVGGAMTALASALILSALAP